MVNILIPESKTSLFFDNFSFIYGKDRSQKPAVSNISFNLKEGEILILAGSSGSGKSTLSFAMNGMIPWRIKGFAKGDVKVFGKSIWDYEFMELSKTVGLVKQNPLEQLVTFTVKDEIAFGLENLKYPEQEIENRIENIAEFMEISHLLDREIDQLSGGQKQLTILSSFLVMDPKILILDEPIAFLDQNSESLLLDRLNKLVKSKYHNITLVIIEHRLSRVIDIADKIVVLGDDGKIALMGGVDNVLRENFNQLRNCNIRVPWLYNIFDHYDNKFHPASFTEALRLIETLNKNQLYKLKQILIENEIEPIHLKKLENFDEIITFDNLYIESLKDQISEQKNGQNGKPKKGNIILETKNLNFEYPNTDIKAIQSLSIKIEEGDFIGLIGPNGSGKTTLLYLLAGLYEPISGEIFYKSQNISDLDPYEYARKIGFIFQNPESMIFKSTMRDELLYGPRNFNIEDQIEDSYVFKLISLIGNEPPDKNPFNLSWGQKRRLNLSSVFIYNPDIILLDEPFIGQDQKTIEELIETLFIENKRGKTIIISSHDYHLLLKYTKKIMELNEDGTLRDYDLNGNYFTRHQNLGPVLLLDKINQQLHQKEG
ncbi:MAG: ATP-binding cassette domain-containing protein [Candidatus Lokiarchaeota archaeon]|nr:ATP-binding cassette domain-containing protein [Candidatus Lokiarchaeota archaeon]